MWRGGNLHKKDIQVCRILFCLILPHAISILIMPKSQRRKLDRL